MKYVQWKMTFILPGSRALRYNLLCYEIKGNCWDKVEMKHACIVQTIKIKTWFQGLEKRQAQWRIISREKWRKRKEEEEKRRMLHQRKAVSNDRGVRYKLLVCYAFPLLNSMQMEITWKCTASVLSPYENKARGYEFNEHGVSVGQMRAATDKYERVWSQVNCWKVVINKPLQYSRGCDITFSLRLVASRIAPRIFECREWMFYDDIRDLVFTSRCERKRFKKLVIYVIYFWFNGNRATISHVSIK